MHYKRVCVCGRVLAQCRCMGPKRTITVQPCKCVYVAPKPSPDPPYDWSKDVNSNL